MPESLMNGKFTLYETPDGGYHIAYQCDGDDDTRHITIPAMMVKIAKQGMDGKLNPMQALKAMMSNGTS